MNISEQKDLILPAAIGFLKRRGYKYHEASEDIFIKKTNWGGVKISLYFSAAGESSNSLFELSLKKIEDVMLQIGVPYNQWIKQKKGTKLLYTIYDIFSKYKFTRRFVNIGSKEAQEIEYVDTHEDVIKWREALFSYIDNDGINFINKFTFLPNVLNEMNKFDHSHGPSYLPFLQGRIDHLFRGLIISKLCNDPHYDDKLLRIKESILQPEHVEWHPYLVILESKLDLLNAEYNLDSI